MTEFEPQRGKFAGHGIEVEFIRRFMGDRREDMIESVKVNGRPLVVIDPEDREAVERLNRLQDEVYEATRKSRAEYDAEYDVDVMQAALWGFAKPEPKFDEPVGLGAVVEDESGQRWIRATKYTTVRLWRGCDDHTQGRRRWDEISAVRILSEGVPDA